MPKKTQKNHLLENIKLLDNHMMFANIRIVILHLLQRGCVALAFTHSRRRKSFLLFSLSMAQNILALTVAAEKSCDVLVI